MTTLDELEATLAVRGVETEEGTALWTEHRYRDLIAEHGADLIAALKAAKAWLETEDAAMLGDKTAWRDRRIDSAREAFRAALSKLEAP